MKKIVLPLAAIALFAACKPDLDTGTPSAGEADFSRYVAVGNSLTSGFADGSLYRSGQINSFPNMLATQFKSVGGGDFKQPLLPGESGWPIDPNNHLNKFTQKFVLGNVTDCKGLTSLMPKLYPGPFDTAGSSVNISAQGPFNNVGVPGIRATDYTFKGYAAFNPYAARFYKDPLNQAPLDEALRINASFFTIWLGANDVLGYAIAGGEGNNGGLNTNDISDPNLFQTAYDEVVNQMTKNGAKGVLINIPDITSVPFFNTIPTTIDLSAAQATQLNVQYAASGLHFQTGTNKFVVQDKATLGLPRFIKDGESILLTIPLDSIKCYGWGTTVPIPSRYVLDASEINNIKIATQKFNQVIANNASKHNLGYVDMNAYLKTIQTGIYFNGVAYNAAFGTGGAFSLDGIHLTPRGYALAANEIIRVINSKYKANIPMIDVNIYSGVKLP